MHFLDLTLPTPAENLALDEALLLDAEDGHSSEVLRFWEWPRPAVVRGARGRLAVDVKEAACALDGIPILRRNSGGGTVLLGSGCLLFSLILRYERSDELREIGSSYCHIFRRIRAALAPVVADVECAGTSDLTIHGRKFSGNAQQRKRAALLHHGTLLYQFDLERVARYLHPPERQPEYRAGREHADFLMNLPASAEELKTHLRTEWDAATELAHWPRKLMTQLVATKYTNSEWICRR